MSYSINKKTSNRNTRHSRGVNFTFQSFTFHQPTHVKYAKVDRINFKNARLEHIIDEQ